MAPGPDPCANGVMTPAEMSNCDIRLKFARAMANSKLGLWEEMTLTPEEKARRDYTVALLELNEEFPGLREW